MKVFWDVAFIWIGGKSRADGPPQCWRASPNLLRIWTEQKDVGKKDSLLFDLASNFLCSKLPWVSDLQIKAGIYTIGFLVLKTANYTSYFPGSPVCKE